MKELIVSNDAFESPEFQALAEILNIDLTKSTQKLVITLDANKAVLVSHTYEPEKA